MSEPDWQYLLSEQVRLYSRYYYRFAHRMLRDDAAVQEVCQQAFQRAWEHREGIIDPTLKTLTSWILQTVKTECLQRLRRQGIEQRGLAIHAARHAAAQPDLDVDPEAQNDLREAVLAAVERLPEPTRSIVKLRHLDGMTPNEVMALVGCSRSDFWRRMQGGLEQLRGLLSDDWRYDRE